MQVVLESHHEKETRLGVALSVALHAAPFVVALLAGGVVLQSESLADRFVTYFVPPNKVGSIRSPERRMTYGQTVDREREERSAQRITDQPTGQPGPAEPPAEDSAGGGRLSIPEPERDPEPVWTELEVDSTVLRHPLSVAPSYPQRLLEDRIEGTVYVAFVVDSTGLALPGTFRVIRSSHRGFAEAVREALPMMRFRPAYLGGRPVRQLVEQPFTFRIRTPVDTASPRSPRPPS